MGVRYFGSKVQRLEDPRLLTGRGRYVDDIHPPLCLQAAFVRSMHAHALIKSIDADAARGMPGVVAIYTMADFADLARGPLPQTLPAPILKQSHTYHPLAQHEVCHAGEAIAIVLAESRAQAEDAAALVLVDYDPLPVLADCRQALAPDAVLVHRDAPDNLVATMRGTFGDTAAVFSQAPHVFRERIEMHRGGCHAMECRGVIANADALSGQITLYTSTQSPYLVRRFLAAYLGREESDLRVIAPDVGGGFGPKAAFYPEEAALTLAALRCGRPVKWIEDRREHFYATTQQRDQYWDVEVAAAADGRLLAVRGTCLHDNGAYVPYGLVLPATTIGSFPGPYALQALDITLHAVYTNMVPNTPVRGAGRPNACFILERLADRVARELKLPPEEVRRRSFVHTEQMPYTTGMKARDGSPVQYDSGDFHATLNLALEKIDAAGFAARQAAARAEGRYIGLGIASCVEDTGLAPFEGATVRVLPTGRVQVQTGAASQGQGHATVLAQICADMLGVALDQVSVEQADTGKFPLGIGTIASRVAVTAGSSVHVAAQQVREKALRVAADMLEAAEVDLEIEQGVVRVKGVPGMTLPLGAIAGKLNGTPGIPTHKGLEPGLSATAYFDAKQLTFANGANACEVEVDIETGAVRILRYVVAHDCGRLINPQLVDGQIIGGVVHGIGNALFERMVYDESGQPLTTNYGEYLLPIATEMPRIEIHHLESPAPGNPLGIKGAGEGGTIPAAAAVIAAVENALAPFNAQITKHPLGPEDILALLPG
ncbi:xanthine dehydrogenase family protein molybdopterin-binding subunit [Ferrovibrio sp.]|uniref:xanthine dehydrogenase family protein molybdopterin-binding subunit n=1 Tax=Ferrovibrio sp. TaxID=1917215 RepID=UPI001B4F7EE0|nr:xanthine dehydrogenase family protein molybdopterin-binding subunit [Ferrovibrio sp.]MBP7064812.1 xanthine dehydrogenase family protein [Ferrovibrio sp.]